MLIAKKIEDTIKTRDNPAEVSNVQSKYINLDKNYKSYGSGALPGKMLITLSKIIKLLHILGQVRLIKD